MPSREIARRLERSHDTIKGYLGSCGATIKGTYYLNALAAGRCWNGPGRIPRGGAAAI